MSRYWYKKVSISVTFVGFSLLTFLGTVVSGTFHCHKNPENSRELDVEIHYTVKAEEDSVVSDMFVQMYKVR